MPLSVDIRLYTEVEFPDGKYLFLGEMPSDCLLFRHPKSQDKKVITARDYSVALSRGTIRVSSTLSSGGEVEETTAILPGNLSADKELEARTRHFYVCEFDRSGLKSSKINRTNFLARKAGEARERGLTSPVSPRMLGDDLKKGTPDHRPLSVYVSHRGLAGGNHVHPFIDECMKIGVHLYYRENKSIDTVFREIKKLIALENIRLDEAGVEQIDFPSSARTLQRRIDASYNYENVLSHYGKAQADILFHGTTPAVPATAPLERVIIDHTVLDVIIIDADTGLVLGRPILSFALCEATRAIVGFIISFEPPSTSRLMSLIRHMVRDKYDLRIKYPDLLHDWETYGVPIEILLDRSLEHLGRGLRESAKSIGIHLEWAPPHNGQYKAHVERLFGLFNAILFHKLPGAVAHSPKDMRLLQHKPAESAELSLEDVTRETVRAIIDYEHRYHGGIKTWPANAFSEGLKHAPRRLLPDADLINELIGNSRMVSLFKYGINLNYMRFQNPHATTEFLNAEVGKSRGKKKGKSRSLSVQVKMRFDPADCSRVFVYGEIGGRTVCREYVNNWPRYSFMLSFEAHRQIAKRLKQLGKEHEEEDIWLSARYQHYQIAEAQFRVGTLTEKRSARKTMEERDRLAAIAETDATIIEGFADKARSADRDMAILVSPPALEQDQTRLAPGAPGRGVKKAQKTRRTNDAARAKIEAFKKGVRPSDRTPVMPDDEELPSFLSPRRG